MIGSELIWPPTTTSSLMCDKMDDLREVRMIYLALEFARDEKELMSSIELLIIGWFGSVLGAKPK